VQGLDELVQVKPPGDEVAVYPVIALPPLDPGTVQLTKDEALATVQKHWWEIRVVQQR
jgi:hypothetical protein